MVNVLLFVFAVSFSVLTTNFQQCHVINIPVCDGNSTSTNAAIEGIIKKKHKGGFQENFARKKEKWEGMEKSERKEVKRLQLKLKNCNLRVSWSSINAVVFGAGSLRVKSKATQIGNSVAKGSLSL